jgi:hypothetical protein
MSGRQLATPTGLQEGDPMKNSTVLRTGAAIACAAALAGACERGQTPPPEVQTTTGVQPRADAVTVTGCLKSGALANDTWVVISKPSAGETVEPVTYELVGGDSAALREHAGKQVEINGVIQAEQQIASRGTTSERPAKGTTGTAKVETRTELSVRQLSVGTVRAIADTCQ